MSAISSLPQEVRDWLASQEALSYIVFLTEFPPIKKAVPLKKITVAVGIGGIEIDDDFPMSEPLGDEEFCRDALVNLRFSIHVPYSMGGVACHETFTKIVDSLTFASPLEITKSGCKTISEDRNTNALVLRAFTLVKANLCPAEKCDIPFPSFLDKILFCGTHIRDENIHLSESQQEFLNEPFTQGTYYGTGLAERNISFGFKPRVVIVGTGGYPPFEKIGDYNKIYTASGVQNSATLGLTLTGNGFKVSNGQSFISHGAYPALNESGVTYSYIALR